MKLSTLLVSMLLAVGLTACSKPEEKKAEAAPAAPAVTAPAVTAPALAAPAEAKPAEVAAVAGKSESKEKDGHSAGQGVMKEVCHDKVKDGKTVMGKDGKPEQECKTIKVRQKLEATEIPPAKK
jgi:hypothetical protein